MRRMTVLFISILLAFGGLSLTAPAANACPDFDCTLDCVAAVVNNPKDPVCPA